MIDLHPNVSMNRNDVIAAIKDALKRRSGKSWSVTGGRGTAYGWIEINSPPQRRVSGIDGDSHDPSRPNGGHYYMSRADREELAHLLGKDQPIHCQGESIPASHDYYREYLMRAMGHEPTTIGEQYWD